MQIGRTRQIRWCALWSGRGLIRLVAHASADWPPFDQVKPALPLRCPTNLSIEKHLSLTSLHQLYINPIVQSATLQYDTRRH